MITHHSDFQYCIRFFFLLFFHFRLKLFILGESSDIAKISQANLESFCQEEKTCYFVILKIKRKHHSKLPYSLILLRGNKTKDLEHLRRFSGKSLIIIHNYGPQSIAVRSLIARSQTLQFPAIISKVTGVIYKGLRSNM